MARAIVRGMDPHWIRSIYSVALKPDAVFYLRLGIDQLLPRVIFTRGFDYWESGMDLYPGHDMYDSFCNYQAALLASVAWTLPPVRRQRRYVSTVPKASSPRAAKSPIFGV